MSSMLEMDLLHLSIGGHCLDIAVLFGEGGKREETWGG